jgi:hypothetical protein
MENVDITTQKQRGGITGKGFEPGQSGNPKGRPPGSVSITAEIKKKLQEIPEGQQKSYLELLINRILKQAVVDGNEQMIKQIWSYIDGTPRQAENSDPATPVIINVSNKTGMEVREENGERIPSNYNLLKF